MVLGIISLIVIGVLTGVFFYGTFNFVKSRKIDTFIEWIMIVAGASISVYLLYSFVKTAINLFA